MKAVRRPVPGTYDVDSGRAELLGDADRRGCWVLLLDGTPQSHVDLDDPTYLDFEYVRRLGHLVDLTAPTGLPIDVVHLGAGALTLARYIAATRPGSRQRAFDVDAALIDLVRRELPLARTARVRVRPEDARTALRTLRPGAADLIVCDVFAGAQTPAHLTSVEFVREVARVLRPAGRYAVNIGDGPPLGFARAQMATVRAVFPHVSLLADPGVLRGRRFGNLVCAASRVPLPEAPLVRRCAGDPAPGRVLAGTDLARFAGSAAVVTDATAVASPRPPEGTFGTG